MKSLKTLLVALAVALPVSLLGADLSANADGAAPVHSAVTQGPPGQACCWRYVHGRWMCIPCANPDLAETE